MTRYVVRSTLMIAALLALILLSSLRSASADSGARSYQYVLGSGPLCELEEAACPDVAMADNGDTIDIAGAGALSIHTNSIGGGGTFTHHFSGGSVSGTWAANKLLGFHE